MARMLPASESLFVESALREVLQALNTLRQLNSYIYMQKFIIILMKTDKQNSPQSNSPVARFLQVILVQRRAWEEIGVPAPPLSFLPKIRSFHSTSIYLRPPDSCNETNFKQG